MLNEKSSKDRQKSEFGASNLYRIVYDIGFWDFEDRYISEAPIHSL